MADGLDTAQVYGPFTNEELVGEAHPSLYAEGSEGESAHTPRPVRRNSKLFGKE
jgi:hypothetical protein